MDYKVGDEVVFVDADAHAFNPMFYPEKGTIGKVEDVRENELIVQWPEGSTSYDNLWGCRVSSVCPYR